MDLIIAMNFSDVSGCCLSNAKMRCSNSFILCSTLKLNSYPDLPRSDEKFGFEHAQYQAGPIFGPQLFYACSPEFCLCEANSSVRFMEFESALQSVLQSRGGNLLVILFIWYSRGTELAGLLFGPYSSGPFFSGLFLS